MEIVKITRVVEVAEDTTIMVASKDILVSIVNLLVVEI